MKGEAMKKKAKKTMGKIETKIVFVLDETGSMLSAYDQTITGFNEYVETLKKGATGKVTMTLVKFNANKGDRAVFVDKGIKDVPQLSKDNYKPDACTPLYDAIGRTINSTTAVLKGEKAKFKVLFIVMTDGEENASQEFDRFKIFELIKEKEKTGKWSFVYLGANQDSWKATQGLGFHAANVANYNQAQTQAAFRGIAGSTLSYANSSSSATQNFYKGTNAKSDEDQKN
jgi:hypothetical protein